MKIDFVIGLIAGIFSTLSFLPQVIKAFKTKRTEDLSLATFVIFSISVVLWLTYGILIRQIPVILANITTLALALLILVMKIKYG